MIAVESILMCVILLAAIAGLAVTMRGVRNRKRGTWLPREWARKISASSSKYETSCGGC